jgi:hypothetical protein
LEVLRQRAFETELSVRGSIGFAWPGKRARAALGSKTGCRGPSAKENLASDGNISAKDGWE